MDDKVDEGKGWSARQAPKTKTHNTHILVVSKKGSLLLQIPLHLIHNTHSCSLKSPQEDKKPCFPERADRRATSPDAGRRLSVVRATKICRPPPFNSSPRSAGTHPPVNSSRCGSSPRTRRRCNTSDPCSSGEKQQAERMDKNWIGWQEVVQHLRLFWMFFPINIILLDQAMDMWFYI